jgi:hypothetical protein
MTVLTDYGLAALAVVLAANLSLHADGQSSRRLWAASFVAVAAAAVIGGTSHALAPRLEDAARAALWRMTYGFVGLGNLFILAGAAVAGAARARLRRWLIAAAALRFGVSFGFMVLNPDFRYVVYDYAGTLAGLLVLAAWLARHGRPGGGWIAAGVAASLVGAVVQRGGFDPSPAFNHNDLFHVVQGGGLYLYSRGGRLLTDAEAGGKPGHNGEATLGRRE